MLIKIPKNESGSDFVVGDLHGCYDKLMDKLNDIRFNKDVDRLFCVGDLIDRGSQNVECVELLLEPWFYSCMGNHEKMMIENDMYVWYMNGGSWFEQESKTMQRFIRKLTMDKCPVAMEVEGDGFNFGIVHAQTPKQDWNEIDWTNHYIHENALWGRKKLREGLYDECLPYIDNIGMVFHGHTPTRKVIRLGNEIWCDLGVVYEENEFEILNVEDEAKKLGL